MNKLRSFVFLARYDHALLMQAFVCVASCRLKLRLQKFSRLKAWASEMGHGSMPVGQLLRAIRVVLRLTPGVTCLCQALALQRLLARYGHRSELTIGVTKTNDDFRAHAWLVHEGCTLIGGTQTEEYKPLIATGVDGDLASNGRLDSHPV
jgi:hypothetical protein